VPALRARRRSAGAPLASQVHAACRTASRRAARRHSMNRDQVKGCKQVQGKALDAIGKT
jgi:hypothetical protein